ncbi:putative ArsR family transcriptional regulator [Catenulispora sp. GP43]|uniref:winged helix-turn-helix domain-containing protein n=1 Tax=Catenulispora sp. GP43 TaxID=3156263 RepID=UPI00351724AA
MTGSEHDDALHLTDPQAIRAYAHRTRMALVALLRTDGPLTATRAAELTGESVASCSYHLRMLAKYGLVEEVPGPGRQKPWRATAQFTSIPRAATDPAVAAATAELRVFLAQQYFEEVLYAERNWDRLPKEWQEAEAFGDRMLYLTPAELLELRDGIDALISRFDERNTTPELRPEGAELVQVLRIAYRKDRRPAGGAEDGTGTDTDSGTGSDSTSDAQGPQS